MPNGFKLLHPESTHRTDSYWADGVALFSLALLTLALHHSALSGSWRWDDGMHLLHTTQYPWTSVFLDPDVMRSVSGNQFAPWNLFLYYVNGALFGANARWYYAHHLVSLWAAAAGLYVLLRHWLPAHRAWATPALLLLGIPTFQMAQQLMVGHYIDGLVFASFGLALQIRAVKAWDAPRSNAVGMSLAGALLYGLACLCKEIYVPWILMWLVVPRLFAPSAQRVAVCAAPALVVAAGYTLARLHIFGGAGGYYGGGASSWDVAHISQSLATIPGALFGDGARGLAALLLMGVALCASAHRSRAWWFVCASALLVTLFPLIILASSNPPWALHARYLWAPWILVCLAWAAPWKGVFRRAQWVVCLLFTLLVVWQISLLRPDDQQREAMFDAHSRMLLEPPSRVTHWASAEFNGAGYMSFVSYAAHEALRRTGSAVGNPPQILRAMPSNPAEQSAARIWDAACNCFQQFSALTSDERTAALVRVQSEKGLLVPGIHPLADAYQGPTPEMRIEENRYLRVSGAVASEGPGHVLLLAGWAPSKLIASNVTTEAASPSAAKVMRYEMLLEAPDTATAQQTQQRLCVLMQSQAQPYTFVALNAMAPASACRNLLTPWALRQPMSAQP